MKKPILSLDRKGLSLREGVTGVLLVLMIGILFVVFMFMFSSFQSVIGSTNATSVRNETQTINNGTGTGVNGRGTCNFANFAVFAAINSTGTTISSGNYTTTATGYIIAVNGSSFQGKSWNVSYSFTDGGATCTSVDTLNTNFSNQIPLIGLVLAIVLIGIVIGTLVTSFFMRRINA